MPYEIVIGDISNLSFHVDVIVTLAHPTPGEVGYGVDRAIYRRTGDQLKEDRRRMGPFVRGGMIMTSSYGLNADRLIHVLVPFYQNGEQGEQEALRKCYDQVLTMAYDHKYRSIAFPLMSSGNYGFPIKDAYRIAMHAFHEFCETHDMDVYLIIFGDATIGYCNKQRMNIQVDTPLATLAQREKEEYPRSREETYRLVRQSNEQHTQTAERIDDIFRETADQDIFEVLYELMVETTKRLDCSERSICESVNLSPGDFSTHINNSRKSIPAKRRLLAYAIAFQLNLDKTTELLNRAGYSLQRRLAVDSIVMKHIEMGDYDIHSINADLESQGLMPFCVKTRKSKKTDEVLSQRL